FGSHFHDFRYSLVVQFSKIKLVVSAAYRVTSNSYNISHPTDQCKLFFQLLFELGVDVSRPEIEYIMYGYSMQALF
ncbi:hypothetical protein, partial [Paenibacillus phytohabitans]|uniref:hypothetical protein n=1 Tax=Paenibacillus phytohabitans TaxID=2654978 RepID=UPI001C129065